MTILPKGVKYICPTHKIPAIVFYSSVQNFGYGELMTSWTPSDFFGTAIGITDILSSESP